MCKKIVPCVCFERCKGTGDVIGKDGSEEFCPCSCHDEEMDWGPGDGYEDQGDRD
jgi:hypothetical protein